MRQVVVEITEGTDGDRFWRGDAVAVLEPSPDRVAPPCPSPGPGAAAAATSSTSRCPASASSRPTVVREQLGRLAGLDVGRRRSRPSRRRGRPAVAHPAALRRRSPTAGAGMRKHRSHDVVPIDDCLIARTPRAGRGPSYRRPRAGDASRSPPTASGRSTRVRPRCWSTRCSTAPGPAAGGVGAGPLRRRRAVRRLPRRPRSVPGAGGRGRGRPHGRPHAGGNLGDGGRGRAGDRSTGCSRAGVRRSIRPGRPRPAA